MEYKAKVIFVSKEPFDSGKGFGPSINTKVKFDDPDTPGTDASGERTIYASVDSDNASVIRGLEQGDRISIDVVKRGNKVSYILMPTTTATRQEPAKATAPSVQQRTSNIWSPMTPEQKAVWESIVQEELGKLQVCYALVTDWMAELSEEERADLATTLFINAQKSYRPSLVLEDDVDQDTALIMMVNPNDEVNSLLDAITVLLPFYENRALLEASLKTLGLTGRDIKGEDSWLKFLHVAKDYAEVIEAGAEHSVAVSIVSDKYGLAAF